MIVHKKLKTRKLPSALAGGSAIVYYLIFPFSIPSILIEQTNPLCHAIPSLSNLPDHGHCIRNLDIVRLDIKIISRR